MLGSTLMVNAQSGTNSPYSQCGLGELADQVSGFNRGMNGVGLGFHEHNQINYLNPASYSSIDSLSFILDAGISGQIVNFEENGIKKNAKNATLDYIVAGLRACKNVGVSFGFVPITTVGYNYTDNATVGKYFDDVTYTNTSSGEGGFHQVYLGAAWRPVGGLSVGANVSYVWGNYTKTINNEYSDSEVKTLARSYTSQVNALKLDFGVQYTLKLMSHEWLTLGVTYSPKMTLGDADMSMTSTASQTGQTYSTSFTVEKALKLPHTFGAGLMWNHADQLKVGLDYTLQKWGDLSSPAFDGNSYVLENDVYSNRSKCNLGVQYCYGEMHRNFFKRVRYRAGVGYASSYYKVNGFDGPKEFSVSAGFGIPLIRYRHSSFLNVSGQWVKASATNLIKQNTFRLNIGFTFNEEWFRKWRMK